MATTTTPHSATKFATKQLGNSDLHITPIGFGAWAIGGGDWQFSWGHQEDDDSVKAIERAVDLGLNWIDTAAIYGLTRKKWSRRRSAGLQTSPISSPSAPCAGMKTGRSIAA